MDFELTADQAALQEEVRRQCQARWPLERLRVAPVRELWAELAETGVFGLRQTGLGWADAVLVFEELGRACVPGPLVSGLLAAEVDSRVGRGERVVGLVESGPTETVVEHPDAIDVLYVLGHDGVTAVDVGELELSPVDGPLDLLTPVARVARLPAGGEVGGPDLAARWRLAGRVLTSALLLGNSLATTDLAVAYAKERRQFDRAIASFQAIKHLLADMLVRAEVARPAVYAAGVTLDDPEVGDPERAAATAKIMAGEAAVANAKTGIQVHGGMGFTWEVDAHLYLKRAWVLDASFGTPDTLAEAMAAHV